MEWKRKDGEEGNPVIGQEVDEEEEKRALAAAGGENRSKRKQLWEPADYTFEKEVVSGGTCYQL